ncbi:hypothetical protein ACFVYE_31240 [Streptomyces sp. NPDC058239]|uniref:hypothetical protein n=1 Tax=Streptomyces sp. NPDC058239 TaxID=3346395 RepID=UPI0036E042CD
MTDTIPAREKVTECCGEGHLVGLFGAVEQDEDIVLGIVPDRGLATRRQTGQDSGHTGVPERVVQWSRAS